MTQVVAMQRIRNRQALQQALDLRRAGATYLQIGQHLSLSTTRAYQLVRAGIDEVNVELKESAASLRQMELDRLDAIHLAHWPHRASPRNAIVLIRLCERRCRLLGLDAPAKVAQITPEAEPLPSALDLSKLTDEQLLQLEWLYEQAGAVAVPANEV